jgi:O-acetyl-ADP-ribose deacetylase (regulator of RNase III)
VDRGLNRAVIGRPEQIEDRENIFVAKGDITNKLFKGPVYAVNAANKKLKIMFTHGLNKVFSKVTDPKEWRKKRKEVGKDLDVSDAVIGPKIRNDESFTLIHALGPKLPKETTLADLAGYKEQVKAAYQHAFEAASKHSGGEAPIHVQVPMISCGEFLKDVKDQEVKEEWPNVVRVAYMEAAGEFTRDHPNVQVCLVVFAQ